MSKKLACPEHWGTIFLKTNSSETWYMALLRQKNVRITDFIDFDSGINEYQNLCIISLTWWQTTSATNWTSLNNYTNRNSSIHC